MVFGSAPAGTTPPSTPSQDALRVGYVLGHVSTDLQSYLLDEVAALESLGVVAHVFVLGDRSLPFVLRAMSRLRAPVSSIAMPSDPDARAAVERALSRADFLSPLSPAERAMLLTETSSDAMYHALGIAQAVRHRGIQVLHACFSADAGIVASAAARLAGIPFTVAPHLRELSAEGAEWLARQRTLANASAIITATEASAAHIRDRLPELRARCVEVHQGVDLERLPLQRGRRHPTRIVAVGSMASDTGLGDALTACALLRERSLSVECVVIGAGPIEPTLRARARLLGIDESVSFVGQCSEREVVTLVGESALLIGCWIGSLQEDLEGPPRVLLEAMALGTPCIVTEVSGVTDVVRHHDTGIEVAHRRPGLMAGAAGRLLLSPPLRARMADHARRLIESRYDLRANARTLRRVLIAARDQQGTGLRAHA
jgi:glycosyltransferase involved in cell wall biosynthesis